jgi:hypothetical protein
MAKDQKDRYAKQLAWYPKKEKKDKIDKLKKALKLEGSSAILNRAVGDLYEKTFPGESWA